MKRFIFLLCTLCLLMCAGCRTAPDSTSADTPTTPVSAPPEVQPEPEAEPAPKPEPLPEMTDGDAITVNGELLPDGSWLIDDILYVRLWSLAAAMDTEPVWNGENASLTWQEQTYELETDSAQLGKNGESLPLDGPMIWILDQAYVPVVSLCQHLGMRCFDDADLSHLYFTPVAPTFDIAPGYRIPVLMYHGVSDATWGSAELFVSPAELEKQLQYLQDNGYTPIHFSDLAHIDQIEKPVILTFDDGYLDNYTELYPLLQTYQTKATVFVITSSLDNHEKFMTWDQAAEMSASGLVSIQSHTTDHPHLSSLTADQQREQFAQSKLDITRQTGLEPYVLCYPSGQYNQDTLTTLGDYYQFGLKMNGGNYTTGDNVFEINRWYVSRYTDINSFAYMIGG